MTISEATLLAYVDGELGPAEALEVENALADNAALQRQAEALRASRLPYRQAFEMQPLPEVPAELRERLDSWLRLMAQPCAPLPHPPPATNPLARILGLAGPSASPVGGGVYRWCLPAQQATGL